MIAAALLPRATVAQSLLERLVSPGPLAAAHEKAEPRCEACHDPFDKAAQAGLCLSCHEAVAADFAGGTGFHGRAADAAACKSCHTEHKGRGADIAAFSIPRFDHAATDFPLRGGHVTTECAACHEPERPYRAAPSACAACHGADDPHRGGLGDECAACHDESGWAGGAYDHDRTGFPLAGRHATTACAACHIGGAEAETPKDCYSCHGLEDVHAGRFGANCADCHQPTGWATSFDHAKRTGFALDAGHRAAACLSCHLEPKPATACVSCHAADDAHRGVNGTDCARCHDANDWLVSSFRHGATRFPLTGAHAGAQCEDCHVRPATEAKPPLECVSCHRDDDRHRGAFGAGCGACHSEASWRGAYFAHANVGFALGGAHRGVACAACHDPTPAGRRCADCHGAADPHAGGLGQACADCHRDDGWRRQVFFDHDISSFPLVGLHAAAPCEACHASGAYAETLAGCADCHAAEDVHRGSLGAGCADCHNPNGWDFWLFDHGATGFPLSGGHQGVACATCHDGGAATADCAGCHGRDDPHRGGYGRDCAMCHVVDGWRRAAR